MTVRPSVAVSLFFFLLLIIVPADVAAQPLTSDGPSSAPVWTAQMLIGNGFSHDRGIGFGVRGNFTSSSGLYGGVAMFYHMGFPRTVLVRGMGPAVYWGPEAGFAVNGAGLRWEAGCVIGQFSYEDPHADWKVQTKGTSQSFMVAPGVGVTMRTPTGSAGVHLRHVYEKNFPMTGLYCSIGI